MGQSVSITQMAMNASVPQVSLVCCVRRTLTTVTPILATMVSVRMVLIPTPASAILGTWAPSAVTRLMNVIAALA